MPNFLRFSALAFVTIGLVALSLAVSQVTILSASVDHGVHHGSLVGLNGLDLTPYQLGTVGDVDNTLLDADRYLTDTLPSKVSKLPDGRILRTFEVHAVNKEIEIAPGVFFPAWTYNGQVPGPTLRATEGERIRIIFKNLGDRPHTMHFHGFHTSEMDGSHLHDLVPPQ